MQAIVLPCRPEALLDALAPFRGFKRTHRFARRSGWQEGLVGFKSTWHLRGVSPRLQQCGRRDSSKVSPVPSARQRLTAAYAPSILAHMRTSMILDEELLAKARRLSGLKEKTAVVHAGLEALIARESARRLAALGGSEPRLRRVPRRRPPTRTGARTRP